MRKSGEEEWEGENEDRKGRKEGRIEGKETSDGISLNKDLCNLQPKKVNLNRTRIKKPEPKPCLYYGPEER